MATAEKKTGVEIETREVKVDKYHLTLSREEAETLTYVLSKVGGAKETTPRKHTESVFDALRWSGVRWLDDPAAKGSIIFNREFNDDRAEVW